MRASARCFVVVVLLRLIVINGTIIIIISINGNTIRSINTTGMINIVVVVVSFSCYFVTRLCTIPLIHLDSRIDSEGGLDSK